MRPLFAIVPLVALLFWLGEPLGQGAAPMADSNTPGLDRAVGLPHTMDHARPLSASALSESSITHTGLTHTSFSAHMMNTGWQAGR